MSQVIELRRQRAAVLDQADAILSAAAAEERALTDDEMGKVEGLKAQAERIQKQETLAESVESMRSQAAQPIEQRQAPVSMYESREAPKAGANYGDNRQAAELRAVRLYFKGDEGAIREMDTQMRAEARASNDTDMNITTSADGGYLVPTAHFQGIIAKANDIALAPRLGVMPFAPEGGTTMNVPTQTGTTNKFVSTNEASSFDRDAPAFDQEAMTLVKFTKSLEISDELIYDNGSNMMTFLNFYVGEALGLTHNYALITEALANGTSVTLTSTAASVADVPKIVYSLKGRYSANASWIMRRATEGSYRALQGTDFLFAETPSGMPVAGPQGATLWKYPLWNEDDTMPAIAASAKSVLFGNFGYMGQRATGLTMLRDPYSKASTGQLVMHYYTRIVYKVLQAGAILYGTHPTA